MVDHHDQVWMSHYLQKSYYCYLTCRHPMVNWSQNEVLMINALSFHFHRDHLTL